MVDQNNDIYNEASHSQRHLVNLDSDNEEEFSNNNQMDSRRGSNIKNRNNQLISKRQKLVKGKSKFNAFMEKIEKIDREEDQVERKNFTQVEKEYFQSNNSSKGKFVRDTSQVPHSGVSDRDNTIKGF